MKKYSFLLVIATLYLLTPLHSQKLTTKSDRARDLYLKGSDNFYSSKFEQAELYLKKSIDADNAFAEPYFLLADIYFFKNEYSKEAEFLSAGLGIDSTFYVTGFYSLGIALMKCGDFDNAKLNIQKYRNKTKNPESIINADRMLKCIEFSRYTMKHPVNINPQSLGNDVNSPYDEYWPSLTGDESNLIYTVLVPRDTALFNKRRLPRSNPAFFQEDFYISSFDTLKGWSKRQLLAGSINTNSYNEGAQSLSVDGKWLFFTVCANNKHNDCNVYFSKNGINGWSTPILLDYPINTPAYDGQPSFSANGKTLYFVSNRHGGFGGKDIWSCDLVGIDTKNNPIFGQLKNLNAPVNTSMEENYPFIHQDNKTLYFSSDGHIGMGERDLYLTRKDSLNQWGEPINLGYPINSFSDENGLVLNSKGDRAYFSSDRFNNLNQRDNLDLYTFEMPDSLRPTPASYLKGRVFDYNTKKTLSAKFELLDLASCELAITSSTNYKGEFLICLPIGINYALNVSEPGYLFHSQNINLTETNSATHPLVADIYLKPIVKDATIILENIFFDTNSSDLLPQSIVELTKLLSFLQMNAQVRVELSGHTDNVGGEAFNISLSQRRADAVKNYLTTNGIASVRLTTKGFGFSRPITTNDTAEGRARNRRTEMKVIGNE